MSNLPVPVIKQNSPRIGYTNNIRQIASNSPKHKTELNSPRNEERQRRLLEIKRMGKEKLKSNDNNEIKIFTPGT